MRRVAALILAVLALIWAQRVGGPNLSSSSGTALALGFTLLGAGSSATCCAGCICRGSPATCCSVWWPVRTSATSSPQPMAAQLQVITGIATTLIALIAGLTLNLDRLGRAAVGRSAG